MKHKKILLVFPLLISAAMLFGQSAQTATTTGAGGNDPAELARIMTWILASVGALLFIVAMLYMIRVNQFLYKRAMRLDAQIRGVAVSDDSYQDEPEGDDFWTRLRKKYWEDAVPIEREQEIMLSHPHDGILELDNKLPPWWVNMFILTIIWAVGYMFYYHWGGGGPSQAEEYKMEVEKAKKELAVALAGKANAVDENTVTALTEKGPLGEGETIFKSTCAPCHRPDAGGLVGPNLTDDYWLHGGGIKNVFKTIKYGVPDKGMISWQGQLKPADMQKVASYILTLHGTNPPNPKEPQGQIWKEEVCCAGGRACTGHAAHDQ